MTSMAAVHNITIRPSDQGCRSGCNLGATLHVPDANADGCDAGTPRRARRRRYAVLILHPHPKMGGDQNNNVVMKLFGACSNAGFTALKVDTRGVGKSAGSSTWTGMSEAEDVCNVVRYLLSDDPLVKHVEQVFVVGYSFGAAVGCTAVAGIGDDPFAEMKSGVAGIAAVSYPCGWLSWFLLGGHNKHVAALGISRGTRFLDRDRIFFAIGTRDQWASVSQVKKLASTIDGFDAARVVVVDGCDHFFYGHEAKVVQVLAWLLECVGGESKDAGGEDKEARL